MKEWNDPYNPFNSWKILCWREWFENCIKDNYLPPVSVDTDPSYRCNYNCPFCNAYTAMEHVESKDMPPKHLLKLADFYKEWGVKSTCFTENTLIINKNEIKKIKDIRINEEVYNHDGSINKVKNIFKIPYKGVIKEINLGSNKKLEVTPDHKFPIIKYKYCIRNKNRLCTKYCGYKCYNPQYVDYRIKYVKAKDLNIKEDKLLFPLFDNIKNTEFINVNDFIKQKYNINTIIIPDKIKLNTKLLYLIGWYLSEGCVTKNTNHLSFTLNINEKHYASNIIKYLNEIFNTNISKLDIRREKNTIVVNCGAYNIGLFFKTLFGNNCATKKIPNFILELPPQKQLFLLKYLWLGDGNITNRLDKRGYVYKKATYVTISTLLAHGVRILLNRQNIIPNIIETKPIVDKNGVNHKRAYYIYCSGKQLEFMEKLLNSKSDFIGYANDTYRNHQFIEIDNKKYYTVNIKNIKEKYLDGYVYNLEVNNIHTYLTMWAGSKNCIAGGGEPLMNIGLIP